MKKAGVIMVLMCWACVVAAQGVSDVRVKSKAGGGWATVTNDELWVSSQVRDAEGDVADIEDNSLVTIAKAHERVHNGEVYYLKDFVDVANGGSNTFLVVTANTPSNAHLFVTFAAEGESDLVAFKDTTYASTGSAVTVYNRDLSLTGVGTTISIYSSPTGVTNGTRIWGVRLGSGRTAGGDINDSLGWILKSNTVYSLTVENRVAGSATAFDYQFDWFEE